MHPIAMKLSQVLLNMLAVVLKILYVCPPYRSTHRSSDCDEAFTSCCNMPAVVLKIKKKLNIVLTVVLGAALSLQEHTRFI